MKLNFLGKQIINDKFLHFAKKNIIATKKAKLFHYSLHKKADNVFDNSARQNCFKIVVWCCLVINNFFKYNFLLFFFRKLFYWYFLCLNSDTYNKLRFLYSLWILGVKIGNSMSSFSISFLHSDYQFQ